MQLTDLHLTADPNARLKGIPTHAALIDALQFIDDRWGTTAPVFDAIVITGDLAHDEKLETYQELRTLLGRHLERCYFLPGNHDDRQWIRQVFGDSVAQDHPFITFSVGMGGWRLIGLDSHVKGEVPGYVGREQVEWLADQLQRHAQEPTILFIHHPPFPIQSVWLDEIGLQDPDALMEVVRSHPQVRVISAGHVHQEYDGQVEGIRVLTTPSTGLQFTPRLDEPDYAHIPPGFRVFSLEGDRCHTRVIRLPHLKYPPDPAS
ncbi:MAG: phosphodiesterase [Pirellulaceae bacterium]